MKRALDWSAGKITWISNVAFTVYFYAQGRYIVGSVMVALIALRAGYTVAQKGWA
jgi:hypothetical protein